MIDLDWWSLICNIITLFFGGGGGGGGDGDYNLLYMIWGTPII